MRKKINTVINLQVSGNRPRHTHLLEVLYSLFNASTLFCDFIILYQIVRVLNREYGTCNIFS